MKKKLSKRPKPIKNYSYALEAFMLAVGLVAYGLFYFGVALLPYVLGFLLWCLVMGAATP